MENRMKLSIGDWSEDGHNKYQEFIFESNKTVEEIRQAYKDSCKLTGIAFHDDYIENYTGLNLQYGTDRWVAVEYGDNVITEIVHDTLGEHGIDTDTFTTKYLGVKTFCNLLIDFIKLSLPDLILEEGYFKNSELENITPINGWWNDELNVGFGYGLYE